MNHYPKFMRLRNQIIKPIGGQFEKSLKIYRGYLSLFDEFGKVILTSSAFFEDRYAIRITEEVPAQ
jgi:hypothetical protein